MIFIMHDVRFELTYPVKGAELQAAGFNHSPNRAKLSHYLYTGYSLLDSMRRVVTKVGPLFSQPVPVTSGSAFTTPDYCVANDCVRPRT